MSDCSVESIVTTRPSDISLSALFLELHNEDLNVLYRGADKSLARPTSRYILFDGKNISFDASLVIHTHTHTHTHIYI